MNVDADSCHLSRGYCSLPPRFQCIYLPHNFIGETSVFALPRLKVCFCLMPVEQDHGAVVGEGRFALGGKMPEGDAIGGLISCGVNQFFCNFRLSNTKPQFSIVYLFR